MPSILSENFRDIHEQLIESRTKPERIREIFDSMPDGGRLLVEYAVGDMRWSLALGQIDRAEAVLDLLETASSARKGAEIDRLSEIRESVFELRVLVNGVAAILGGNHEEGTTELEKLMSWKELPCGFSWVGTIWSASVARHQRDLARALNLARRALTQVRSLDERANGLTLCMLGELYHEGGYPDRSLAFLEEAEKLFRDIGAHRGLAAVLMSRARVLASKERDEEATRAARQAGELKPEWEDPPVFLAWQALREGDSGQAEKLAGELRERSANSQEARRLSAVIRAIRERRISQGPLRVFVNLRNQPPGPEVISALERLMIEAPNFLPLRELLAWNLMKTGQLERAQEIYDGLAQEQLDSGLLPSVLLGLGRLAHLGKQDRHQGARLHAAASAADEIFPRDAVPMFEGDDDDEHTRVATLEELNLGEPADEMPVSMDVAWKVAFNGDLTQLAVPELIQFLCTGRRTGTLVLTSDRGIGVVHLHHGKLTGAISPTCPNIGDLLLEKGVITREQLDEASRLQHESDANQLLGAVLIQAAGIDAGLVQEALASQVIYAVGEMFGWQRGRFSFEPDQQNGSRESAPDVLLDAQWVLLEACRMLDENNRGA